VSVDRYVCCAEHRRDAWRKTTAPLPPAGISGIDYIEVHSGTTVADPTVIDLVLVRPVPRPGSVLTPSQVRIEGGTRFPAPASFTVATVPASGPKVSGYTITVAGNQPTDFSPYVLRLVAGPNNSDPPAFIDPRLAEVEFSFKVGCQTDADCAEVCEAEPDPPEVEAEFDYRVRDYPGFRDLVLDRLRALVPGFSGEETPDLTTTLAEVIAFRADQQSYRLDWVGTEAFLSTARARASVTRLARLVDYAAGEGASARLYACFDFAPGVVADGWTLPASTPLLLRDAGLSPVVAAPDYARLARRDAIVFETMAPLPLWAWRSRIVFHTWGDAQCLLPRGATATTLVWPGGGGRLAAGDFLVLSEVRSPVNGEAADADPTHRHVVRLTRVTDAKDPLDAGKALLTVEWETDDALPFDLTIAPHEEGAQPPDADHPYAIVQGNVMLCDHGMSLPPAAALGLLSEGEDLRPRLVPPKPQPGLPWQPALDRAEPARVPPPPPDGALPAGAATDLAAADPAKCLPAIALRDDYAVWSARHDLLKSDAYSREFVVETNIAGKPLLRFGDGVNGMAAPLGELLKPSGRFGMGRAGNLGAGALGHVVVDDDIAGAIISVTNPLPASGGVDPEPIASIRINAPQAYRVQERAVTADDYAAAAMRHPEVANAMAFARWTGAWQTMTVCIDRLGGAAVDAAFRAQLLTHMEFYRLMGFDVKIDGARPAPLDLKLSVCVAPGELRSKVAADLRNELRPRSMATGAPGFFHPDNFTFGSPLYLSQLIERAMRVRGVTSVEPLVFKRLGRVARGELADGVIAPQGTEILGLDDDPNFPERGRLELVMGGGR
jgi:hypothetical protein